MSTIEELWDEYNRINDEPDPTTLTTDDIDKIVKYIRILRAGDFKPKKEKGPEKKTVDLAKLMQVTAREEPKELKVYRRF